jgi:prevent-host-death family protein
MYIMMYIQWMSRRYSIAEARSHLPTIVDQAEAGQEVELMRRGKPVAVVVSLREFERLQGKQSGFAQAYDAFLEHHAPSEAGLDEGFAESLRDRSRGREPSV